MVKPVRGSEALGNLAVVFVVLGIDTVALSLTAVVATMVGKKLGVTIVSHSSFVMLKEEPRMQLPQL